MSHFAVLVITDEPPTDEVLTKTLQPYHEFECTGIDDQFIQDIDQTEEIRAEYAAHEDKSDYPTLEKFVEDYHGKHPVAFGKEPDLASEHKYGYFTVDANGAVLKVVDRTNPNRKWDWWVVGGRYKGKLTVKEAEQLDEGAPTHASTFDSFEPSKAIRATIERRMNLQTDSAQVASIDWDGMQKNRAKQMKQWIDESLQEIQDDFQKAKKPVPTKEDLLQAWKEFAEHHTEIQRIRQEWIDAGARNWTTDKDNWLDSFIKAKYSETPAGKAFLRAMDLKLQGGFQGLSEFVDNDAQDPYAWADTLPALSAFAVVKDGKWYEEGKMGWWACVSDRDDEWKSKFQDLISDLKPEQWLTVVDCHI